MNKNYNFLKILAISALLLSPLFSLAAPSTPPARQNSQTNSCTKMTATAQNIMNRVEENNKELKNRKQDRTQNFRENREQRQEQLQTMRDNAAEVRAKVQEELLSLAESDAQKKAVKDFIAAAREAMITRHEAVDEAMENFRSELDSLSNNQQALLLQTQETYRASVQTALDKAKSDCQSGITPATVRTQLMTALQTAKQQMQTAKQQIRQSENSVEVLVKTRNEAVKSAGDIFRATMEKLRTELKTALETTTTEDNKAEPETTE
jgi:DNA repair exonuclease SbcCD ATPase subunit